MILKHLKAKEWALMVACTGFIVLQVWLDLEIPDYMYQITKLLQTGGTVEQVMAQGWPMLGLALGSLGTALVIGYIAAYVATSLAKRVRAMQFHKVQSFSANEINKFSTASLITRATNDVTQVQMAVAIGLQVIIKAPIMAGWAIIKISGKSWQWTSATAVAIIVMLTMIGILMYFVVPRFKKIQWLTDDVNRNMRENLKGIRVIRAYNAEKYQENKFEKANEELTANNLFTGRAMSLMMPVMMTVIGLLSLSIYWIGAILIDAASGLPAQIALFSDMIVYIAYAMQVVMGFMMLVIVFFILPRAIVSARRIEEIIETEPSIKDGTVPSRPGNGEIEFDKVSFKYPGAADYVLRDISFKADQGETIAFIGSTGSGKSTIVNLLLRSYDVTEGSVKVDGVDVRDYTQEALHQKMGYVPQKAMLFSGTVFSNVAYGDMSSERTEADVRTAVTIAQGAEFVEGMKDGYYSSIAQGGTNVSGGQKQRLSIARAVCRRPEIYIFDDSFSALDYRTDRCLRSALKKETADVTSVIVAQRVGTILDADKIVVLDNGSVVGIGKHHELLDTCPVYREIVESQLTEEDMRR
ncbi:MAG TPA: ABC transporter ATP-binding protein [Methanomassiliicoccales archaeon]|nr:ABC transporter ATP-binding protein [Methanomassiliicoccales archaeon]HPR98950.1 ABC transporter ATP-binding protein [Methanomassiliicoccales archaeon]